MEALKVPALCGSSSLSPLYEGVVPLCFIDIILFGVTTIFIILLGGKRLYDVWRIPPPQEIGATKLQLSKAIITLVLAALPIFHSTFHLIRRDGALHMILADFYVSLSWVLSLFILMFEYSRALRNNWVLRTWWVLIFMAYSFYFQTGIYSATDLGRGYTIEFFYGLVSFPLTIYLVVVGLFFNKIPEAYQRLLDASRGDEPVLTDKKTNPEARSNFFSKITFSWLNPVLLLGYKRPLEDSDLYEVPRGFTGAELDKSFGDIWAWERTKRQPSLFKALVKGFAPGFLIAGAFKLGNDIMTFAGPLLLQAIIGFMSDPSLPLWRGFLYVIGMLAGSVFQSICLHQYFFIGYKSGMRVRAALVAAVYRKSFVLSNAARQQSTLGEIVNLQAIDANRLQELLPYLHMIWSAPLQLTVSLTLLWRLLGPSVLAGIFVMIILAPINAMIAKKLLALQKALMVLRDERSRSMNEVLNGVRVIKFFAWEQSFLKRVLDIRNSELKKLKDSFFLRAFSTFLWSTAPVLVAITSFALYTLLGNELTAEKAFTSLALFNIIRFPLNMLPNVITQLVETKVSLTRLSKFLMSEELDPDAIEKTSASNSEIAIEIEHASFKWDVKAESNTLEDISVQLPRGKLIAVVGAVGSGKSSFLSAVLAEVPKVAGKITVKGSTAFAAQQAWMQNATLRDNILFGSPFDANRYDETIRVCELTQDIAMLPNGDQTEIGEKGINLSGGQKQRVSLARAVYQNLDIYLLDDCLSAVDAHVGKNIFHRCITGVLKQKTRILVTHQLQFVSYADMVIVLKDGKVTEIGSYEQLMASKGAFSDLISTHVTKAEEYTEESTQEKEQEKSSEEKSPKAKPSTGKLMSTEEREFGNVDTKVWKAYLVAIGGVCMTSFVLGSYLLDSGSRVGSDYWLAFWSSNPTGRPLGFYLGIYSVLGLLSGVIVFLRALLVNVAGLNASRSLHESMLHTVMRSPMSFFDTTPVGRILNRFSKDVNTLDDTLPRTLAMFLGMIFNSLAVLFVIVTVTPFFLVALLPLGFFYRHIQKYYLQSSRELKRLESISKSPIYAQFSETLNGLSTIRSYNRKEDFIDQNNHKMDINLSAYYVLTAANRWLGIRLEFIGTTVVTLAAGFAVIERTSLGPGLAGLSISYALQLTGALNWLVRMATEAETAMVSVERALNYMRLPSEAPAKIPQNTPSAEWPKDGAIVFQNLKMRYREGLDIILKGISLDIKPKEKVGVVGRTGAGKSSLMLALFRLVEPAEGTVLIDDVDITTIGLDDLRNKLSIIPQDPTLFTGTVRSNLDPFNQHTDIEIWDSLASVHMKTAVETLPLKLESPVSEFGENFSVGQRQLMCLGRALLRKARILVMDEATAAVDFETDSLIQKTIRTEFTNATVLTIAHRIHTIMDYDRVLVLDEGRVAEFDSPQKLSSDPSTIFFSLVHKSGTTVDQKKAEEEDILEI